MIKYRSLKPYKYQLTEEFESELPDVAGGVKRPELRYGIRAEYVVLYIGGSFVQAKHYAWDGPTGPPKAWAYMLGLISKKWQKKFLDKCLEPSCGHDGGYQLMEEGYLDPAIWKDYFDRVFEINLRTKKMSKWWARRWYETVRDFGGRSWIKDWKPKS